MRMVTLIESTFLMDPGEMKPLISLFHQSTECNATSSSPFSLLAPAPSTWYTLNKNISSVISPAYHNRCPHSAALVESPPTAYTFTLRPFPCREGVEVRFPLTTQKRKKAEMEIQANGTLISPQLRHKAPKIQPSAPTSASRERLPLRHVHRCDTLNAVMPR
jgi:hypothetical protein